MADKKRGNIKGLQIRNTVVISPEAEEELVGLLRLVPKKDLEKWKNKLDEREEIDSG